MSQEKKGFLVYLGDVLHKRLRVAAAVNETSMTDIAARAIERELNRLDERETIPVWCSTCGREVDVQTNAGGNPQMATHQHDAPFAWEPLCISSTREDALKRIIEVRRHYMSEAEADFWDDRMVSKVLNAMTDDDAYDFLRLSGSDVHWLFVTRAELFVKSHCVFPQELTARSADGAE